jgi:hypothetical protein
MEPEVGASLTASKENEFVGLFMAFIVLIAVFFLLFRSCSCRSSDTVSTAGSTLNISYAEIVELLDDYFHIKQSSEVGGQPRYIGRSTNGVATLELVGDKANLSHVSLQIGLPDDSIEAFGENTIFLQQFLENVFSWNANAAFDKVIQLMEQSNREGEMPRTTIIDDKQMTVRYYESMGILMVSVSAN